MDSLTGAVASKKVTEALKGLLSTDGNRAFEWKRISKPKDVYKRQAVQYLADICFACLFFET